MISEIQRLIELYARKGVLVDTNILLLYYVGAVNRHRIEKFKRTEQFKAEDYTLLVSFLQSFEKVVATPNILTEVSSCINQLLDSERYPERSRCYSLFAEDIQKTLYESYVPSSDVAVQDWSFYAYGLTDCGIASVARNSYLVLTDDLKFAAYLQSQGIDALNFNNIRPLGWT
ncbi:MAG: PIN domain-containing protein [Cyanobacteria bacterium P01_B01_bin.77]